MIPPSSLAAVRRAIRRFVVLDDDDPVDLVFLASVLANFAPDRDVPVWMIIVDGPASGKTELVSLIQDWKYTWTLPDVVTDSYLLSWMSARKSALLKIQDAGIRILYTPDMGGLMSVKPAHQRTVYHQIRGVHDGFLKKATGMALFDKHGSGTPHPPLVYGQLVDPGDPDAGIEPVYTAVPPELRLGFISSATPEFYEWQSRHHRLGSRFTCFYSNPFRAWDDYKHLGAIDELRAEKARWRPLAKKALQEFLDQAIEEIYDFGGVFCRDQERDRLGAAVKLVQRIAGTGVITDTGARLHPRVLAICRMMAFMVGRTEVGEAELRVGLRIVFSQLGVVEQKILRFALSRPGEWTMRELLDFAGGIRQQYDKPLADMVDGGILDRAGKAGWQGFHRWKITPRVKALVEVFDPSLESAAGGVR